MSQIGLGSLNLCVSVSCRYECTTSRPKNFKGLFEIVFFSFSSYKSELKELIIDSSFDFLIN